jgi:hypothetical protein
VIAVGAPDLIFTPAILSETYAADIKVIRHEGLLLVSDAPHQLLGKPAAEADRGTPQPVGAGREGR